MTALPLLDNREVGKIAAIASRLQSDHDGEILAAGRLLVKALGRHDLRVGEVVERGLKPTPIPSAKHDWTRRGPEPMSPLRAHQREAMACLAFPNLITDWERGFLQSIRDQHALSRKQREKLSAILGKVRAAHGYGEDF